MNQLRQSPILPLGVLLLGVALLLTAGCLQARRDFATRGIETVTEPISGGTPRLGINVHLEQYDDAELDAQLAAIADTGIRTVKQPFYFAEPFDWAAADRLITAVSQHNLTLVPLLDGNPSDQFAPPPISDYATWAGDFAERYGDEIAAYIIWDEPNLTSHWGNQPVNPAEYGALLTAAAAEIRTADSDALIVAAPLAPTAETGPINLSEQLFLQALYDAGVADSFDVVAVKPYGFDTDGEDRRVETAVLNYSRPVLIRELMLANGDGNKAVWAGNWGWNSLPDDWNGQPSIWGATTAEQQAAQTVAAFERAQREWGWMGVMFLENWEPNAPADDPAWGFSIANRPAATAITGMHADQSANVAYPSFHLAQEDGTGQSFTGGWEFSPEFGADSSETAEGEPPDTVTVTFYGTELALRVRRADYRARFYVTVDGQPANALPRDENGTNIVLTAASPEIDELVTIPVAQNLPLGIHTAEITASRGWDQWSLNGFAVGYQPPPNRAIPTLWTLGGLLTALGVALTLRFDWTLVGGRIGQQMAGLGERRQRVLTAVTALIVALSGWLTWGEQAAGIYRRLGDGGQLALTATAAAIFYVTPTLYIYLAALLLLFVLIYFKPAWGLALVALCFPLYVPPLLKPVANYRFSPTEIFMLVTFTAVLLRAYTQKLQQVKQDGGWLFSAPKLLFADWCVLAFTAVATLSLFFTDRLDVATNEWRVVIIEPVLFYAAMRIVKPSKKELWLLVDALIVGGLIVAGYGLWQYVTGSNELITAEGGLLRIRSFYGSPNNVGLYLGRILPILLAVSLLAPSQSNRRRILYAIFAAIMGVVLLLTFSRGAILLGMPAAVAFIFWQWQRVNGRSAWPYLLGAAVVGIVGLLLLLQLPQFAGRFDLRGQTSFFRVALWQASLNMWLDHLWLGVGLDNFLYAYRGEYILNAAWQEPDLNHPHNFLLDFGTRLGLLGVVSGGLMVGTAVYHLNQLRQRSNGLQFALVVGLLGTVLDMLFHGLVDHSFFLVDLAFVFMFVLGTTITLKTVKQ